MNGPATATRVALAVLLLATALPLLAAAPDWPRFRGPNGSGLAPGAQPPTTWSDTQNLKWKAELPGPGTSSPILVGDRVFLTCWTGYGATKGKPTFTRQLVCVFVGIDTTWQFDPSTPETGRFAADVKIDFSSLPIPGGPGLSEADLKIVSFDPATGSIEVYPTSVDVTGKIASTQVQRVAPYFSLGYAAPSTRPTLNAILPVGLSQLAAEPVFLNAAAAPLNLTLSALAPAIVPVPPPLNLTIPAAAQLLRANSPDLDAVLGIPGPWLQASSDTSALLGVAVLRSFAAIDTLPMSTAPSTNIALTGIEGNDSGATQLYLANPSFLESTATISLYSVTGTPLGSTNITLAPKGRWAGRIDSAFALSKPFTGYAIVTATQPLAAASIWNAAGTLAALPGQPTTTAAGPRLYSTPLLSGGLAATRINFANTGTRAVTYMLRAFGENGSPTGQTVNGRLQPGEQYWSTAAEALALSPDTATVGSLVVEADGPLIGDALLQGGQTARAALTLAEPLRAWTIPYVPGPASILSIHNPGANAASVRVRLTGATGASVGNTTVAVPARGRSNQALPSLIPAAAQFAAGSLSLESDQPITAFALFGSLEADIAAVAGQSITTPALPAAAPVIAISPASLDFGPVTAGQTKDLTLSVRNTGNASLSVSALFIASPRFTVVSPSGAFTVAAGAQQTVNLRFAPTAAGSQSASLTVSSNDPAQPTLTIALSGTGQAAIPPANFAGPWTTDFGPMTLSQTGATVTGTYPDYSGTISGTVTANILSANWTQPGTTGTLTFILAANGNNFTGTWTRASGPGSTSGAWNGARVTTPATAPVIELTPASLDFGSVTAGQTKDLTFTLRNTGTAPLSVTGITSNNARFTILSPSGAFSVAAGAQLLATVRFSPIAAGAQTAAIAIASNDPVRPSGSVALAGLATAAVIGPIVLQVDDGSYEQVLGGIAGDVFVVNRLTPARYPATLKAVQIYFHDEGDGLPLRQGISVLSAAHPTGAAVINPPVIQLRATVANVSALGRFVEFPVAPITIESGDFVVGFVASTNAEMFPMAYDSSSQSKGRSYVSRDGSTFQLIETVQGLVPGNFLIRAVVE